MKIRIVAEIRQPGEPAAIIEPDNHRDYIKEVLEVSDEEIDDLIGDGNAHVTASMERSDKSFGNGVSVFSSVTLTCNQDDESIAEAQEWALELVSGMLPDALEKAHELFPPTDDSAYKQDRGGRSRDRVEEPEDKPSRRRGRNKRGR